jgi:hypothetical protein
MKHSKIDTHCRGFLKIGSLPGQSGRCVGIVPDLRRQAGERQGLVQCLCEEGLGVPFQSARERIDF